MATPDHRAELRGRIIIVAVMEILVIAAMVITAQALGDTNWVVFLVLALIGLGVTAPVAVIVAMNAWSAEGGLGKVIFAGVTSVLWAVLGFLVTSLVGFLSQEDWSLH